MFTKFIVITISWCMSINSFLLYTLNWYNGVNKLYNNRIRRSETCSVVSDSLQPHGLYNPWNFPGQNTVVGSLSLLQGVFPSAPPSPSGSSDHGDFLGKTIGAGCHAFLQGIFPTRGSNPGLPHCRWIFNQLSHKGSPRIPEWVADLFSSGSSWPRNQTEVSCTYIKKIKLETNLKMTRSLVKQTNKQTEKKIKNLSSVGKD